MHLLRHPHFTGALLNFPLSMALPTFLHLREGRAFQDAPFEQLLMEEELEEELFDDALYADRLERLDVFFGYLEVRLRILEMIDIQMSLVSIMNDNSHRI